VSLHDATHGAAATPSGNADGVSEIRQHRLRSVNHLPQLSSQGRSLLVENLDLRCNAAERSTDTLRR
jgi:hypothetical protein